MVKQIKIDENNVVLCCSIGGLIEGGIYVEDIPDEVMACPSRWLFIPAEVETAEESSENEKEKPKVYEEIGEIAEEGLGEVVVTAPVRGTYEVNPNFGEVNIEELKAAKIAESKGKLAEWLAGHPMEYTDGKQYSVTAEKQSLLNSNLASYERAQAAGADYPLKWNATGEECTAWTYEALVGLSLAIASYVAPKVAQQQAYEIDINACTTPEELDKVVISYD